MRASTSNIRLIISDLGLRSGGAAGLYVDADYGNDNYDGLGWGSPKATIAGALADAIAWTDIHVRAGIYDENLVIDIPYINIIGEARSGATEVTVAPANGKGVVINTGMCSLKNLGVITKADTAIEVNNEDVLLDKIYVSTTNGGHGIDLRSADRGRVQGCFIDLNGKENAIGIVVNNYTNDVDILDNYITSAGSGLGEVPSLEGYGIGITDLAQDTLIKGNTILDCHQGIYFYKDPVPNPYKGHIVIHNAFYTNDQWDIFDPNGESFEIAIGENYFGYEGWNDPGDSSKYARRKVPCSLGSLNFDYSPLTNRRAWMMSADTRRI